MEIDCKPVIKEGLQTLSAFRSSRESFSFTQTLSCSCCCQFQSEKQ